MGNGKNVHCMHEIVIERDLVNKIWVIFILSLLLLLLLYNIYIAHYITITLSASHYKTITNYIRHQLI